MYRVEFRRRPGDPWRVARVYPDGRGMGGGAPARFRSLDSAITYARYLAVPARVVDDGGGMREYYTSERARPPHGRVEQKGTG